MPQFKNICFTSFNMDIDWTTLNIEQIDKKNSIKYLIYQGEHCQDGKKHIQGFLQFHNKKEMTFIKKLFNDKTLHIEKMRGTPQQARDYCTNEYIDKDGNHKSIWLEQKEYGEIDHTSERQRTDLLELKDKIVEGQKLSNILIESTDSKEIHNILQYNRPLKKLEEEIQMKSIKQKLLVQYENVKWNDFQTELINIVNNEVDDRQVYWYYDYIGNQGKSYISKYLQLTKDVYYITGGKQNDILYGYEGEGIVIIDLARTYADNLEHIYTIIENLKNGQYLSTKYETKQKLFSVPHIIVMANFQPDTTKLSQDRWNIKDITDYNNLPDHLKCKFEENNTKVNDWLEDTKSISSNITTESQWYRNNGTTRSEASREFKKYNKY